MSQICPVTYFPTPTQRQFQKNRELIRGKPYEHYFNGDLWLHADVLPALQQPMDPRDVLPPNEINSLLEPGYQRVETGYCKLPEGGAYVASLVPLPGCTGEMYKWWFWWHCLEPARYTLWYPHNHITVRPSNPAVLHQPGLSHEQRYIGTTHDVDEYIGPDLVRVAIRFVAPSEIGLDESRFAQAGVVGLACARVGLRGTGLEVVTMVHLARQVEGGIEQRSRYWLGHNPRLQTRFGSFDMDPVARHFGIKRCLVGGRVAYEQLLHDQIEFTHLSTFLPALYREFAVEARAGEPELTTAPAAG